MYHVYWVYAPYENNGGSVPIAEFGFRLTASWPHPLHLRLQETTGAWHRIYGGWLFIEEKYNFTILLNTPELFANWKKKKKKQIWMCSDHYRIREKMAEWLFISHSTLGNILIIIIYGLSCFIDVFWWLDKVRGWIKFVKKWKFENMYSGRLYE